jgi:hypothetical protein
MGRRLNTTVHVHLPEGSKAYGPGDDVPKEHAALITNPKAWADGDGEDGEDGGIPPRAGKGSGKDAWVAYAAANDVDHDPDATRDEIVAAVESAGVPVE